MVQDTGLVDAADLPLAGNDDVVRSILVQPGAEAGRAELRGIAQLINRVLTIQ